MSETWNLVWIVAVLAMVTMHRAKASDVEIGGVYPALAMFNSGGECGTGAVVPWADRLWVITYSPHSPLGSSDKLYEISPALTQTVRPESVGGTPANRMIHRESNQLNIGPYFIDADRNVRVIQPHSMPGRLTGTARHLVDPENRIYIATMEEGLYAINVHTLDVEEHISDRNPRKPNTEYVSSGFKSKLPGYHGKGLYSGQGKLFYANNGEHGPAAHRDPTVESGALAEWMGEGDWALIRRNQFTELTGPGGIHGSERPETDPVWTLGWDEKSLLLMMLDAGEWHTFRLPKASHSYDGAHGWNTEWPRIRDIGEPDLLATMHGTFWAFPRGFRIGHTAGIAPRSNYLKIVGDFCRWGDRVVLGCDDAAQKEFLNTRSFKTEHVTPERSNSNLWFVEPERIDQLGPALGRGSVWLREDLTAGQLSDPYLFGGYDQRVLHITHRSGHTVNFAIEIDVTGDGKWQPLASLEVPAEGYRYTIFAGDTTAAWVRVRAGQAAQEVTVQLTYSTTDDRGTENGNIFNGLARVGEPTWHGGVVRSLKNGHLGLAAATVTGEGQAFDAYYELHPDLKLRAESDERNAASRALQLGQQRGTITADAASVIFEENGQRYRLPKNDAYSACEQSGLRIAREVVTERDLMNCHGTFYELPARNAQGMAKIRPIATHNLVISDFGSWRGVMVMAGVSTNVHTHGERIFASDDGQTFLWLGVIDDLWQMGKPRGQGGPWLDTAVKAGIPSDPYLMTAYDRKSVALKSDQNVDVTLEVDLDGTGLWVRYKTFSLQAGTVLKHSFEDGFGAYWVRAVAGNDATLSVQFDYH